MNEIFKIKNWLSIKLIGENAGEVIDIGEVDNVIDSLGIPKDHIERSYFQYICQKKKYASRRLYSFLYNLTNIISFVVFFMLLLIPFPKHAHDSLQTNKKNAVFLQGESASQIIPKTLLHEFDNIYFHNKIKMTATLTEKKYMMRIWKRYPFSYTFLLKVYIKMMIYRYLVEKYQPCAIIAASEYSYTSSILTDYCQSLNIEHINVMHGEVYKTLERTFFIFNRFYVWDKYYEELCVEKLKAAEGQFIVEMPPCLMFDKNIKPKIKYKYYLQNQTLEQMKQIKKALDSLDAEYIVRPHPHCTNKDNVHKVFARNYIEDEQNTDIEKSIMEAENAIATHSTVLFQAYCNGRNVIIDDVTNRKHYDYCKEAGYIMLNKNVKMLSEIMRGAK